ncbi:hypothetical protein D9T14_06160, partial [Propionibacterium australiense]
QIGTAETGRRGNVRHVEVFQMGSVRTSILGRPRLPPLTDAPTNPQPGLHPRLGRATIGSSTPVIKNGCLSLDLVGIHSVSASVESSSASFYVLDMPTVADPLPIYDEVSVEEIERSVPTMDKTCTVIAATHWTGVRREQQPPPDEISGHGTRRAAFKHALKQRFSGGPRHTSNE